MGAFCSPLVATQFSQARHWSFHYIISAGIAVSNTVILCAVFRFKRQEGEGSLFLRVGIHSLWLPLLELLMEIGQEPSEDAFNTTPTSVNLYQQIFNIRVVHLLAVFALIYVGVEVTIGGMPQYGLFLDAGAESLSQAGSLLSSFENVTEVLRLDTSRLGSLVV